jgi:hypothetical protein
MCRTQNCGLCVPLVRWIFTIQRLPCVHMCRWVAVGPGRWPVRRLSLASAACLKMIGIRHRQQCRVPWALHIRPDCRVDSLVDSRRRAPLHPAPHVAAAVRVSVRTQQHGTARCIGLGACASAELQGGVAFIHRTGATKAHSPRHAIVQVLHPVSMMYDFGTYLREVCRQHGYRGERAVRYFCRGRGYQLGQKSGRAYGGSK